MAQMTETFNVNTIEIEDYPDFNENLLSTKNHYK